MQQLQRKKNFTCINSFMVLCGLIQVLTWLQSFTSYRYIYIFIYTYTCTMYRSLGHTAWSVPRLGTSSMTKRSGCFGSGLDKQIERSTDGRSFNRGTFKLEALELVVGDEYHDFGRVRLLYSLFPFPRQRVLYMFLGNTR